MRVLILEDEPAAARELAEALAGSRPSWTVEAPIDSVEGALEWFGTHAAPDLVISDIQLADGLSFDVFRRVVGGFPIVFCTAFDEYAVRAFEQNSIDYLLKPVDPARLERALAKFEGLRQFFAAQSEDYGNRLKGAIRQAGRRSRSTLLARGKDRQIPLPVGEIRWIRSSGGVTIAFSAGRRHVLDETLDELEASLDPWAFRRANRQFLVARSAIEEVRTLAARKLEARLVCEVPEPVVVSKAAAPEFLRWLRETEAK